MSLPCVEVTPSSPPVASVVWLHGLGDSGHGFSTVPAHLGLPEDLPVRFVFPHAPMRPVTLNAGMVMQAWYDVHSLERRDQVDVAGMRESHELVTELLQREVERGIPPERTVLGGFSQGGAMALITGLRHPRRLAGIMCLSAYLHLEEELQEEAAEENRSTPIFQAHGEDDPMVAFHLGVTTREILQGMGYQVEWHQYPIGHSVCEEELTDIGTWLRAVLAATS